jgi:hypothetical protein
MMYCFAAEVRVSAVHDMISPVVIPTLTLLTVIVSLLDKLLPLVTSLLKTNP